MVTVAEDETRMPVDRFQNNNEEYQIQKFGSVQ